MFRTQKSTGFYSLVLGIVMGLVVFGLTLAVIQAGSSCVNREGCLKKWCKDKANKLKGDSRDVIKRKIPICGERNMVD